MIAAKTNLEITAYQEKFFLGLSLRQLACFAAAAALAVLTCFVCVQGLHWDMQVVSYLVMAEVLPFMGLGFIRRDGYPFEKLVKIYWVWHRENPQVPLRPYKECHNDKKKRIGKGAEWEFCFCRNEKAAKNRRKAACKDAARLRKAIQKGRRAERAAH